MVFLTVWVFGFPNPELFKGSLYFVSVNSIKSYLFDVR